MIWSRRTGGRWSLIDGSGATTDLGRFDIRVQTTAVLDSSGQRVAALKDPDAAGTESNRPKRLVIGEVRPGGTIATVPVPEVEGYAVGAGGTRTTSWC